MSTAQGPYIDVISKTLMAALCIVNHASQTVERHNKPEVEEAENKELILNPVVIRRDEHEACLIEASINSVRISVSFRKSDALEEIIADRFMKFLMQRADKFVVLRRKAVEGYDLSFLITNFHSEIMFKDKVVRFIIEFIKSIGKEINNVKLQQNARSRQVVARYLLSF